MISANIGTLKTKKMEELIVHVENPIERLEGSVSIVEDWLAKSEELTEEKQSYLKNIKTFNNVVADNDLPEFYDPIESALYKDNLDSYSFTSILNFMTSPDKRTRFDISYEGSSFITKEILFCIRFSSFG